MISFVGAGPGAPDLITLRGAARLGAADLVVWASSLVPAALLDHVRPDAKIHDSAVMTLEDVLAVYQEHPDAPIVRLHSGDPSIYGAIQEQIDWCLANQREFEMVPGVSSLAAAAAALGRELTIPTVSQSVVLTRLAGRTAASVPQGNLWLPSRPTEPPWPCSCRRPGPPSCRLSCWPRPAPTGRTRRRPSWSGHPGPTSR